MSSASTGIDQLASLLKSIHSIEPVARVMAFEEKIEKYSDALNGSDLSLQLRALSAMVQRHILFATRANSERCLCHNDLLVDNIIVTDTGRLVAIDWEYAATGDPYFDLATVVEGHGLAASAADKLLIAYHQRPITAVDLKRLTHCRIIYCYLELLWYGARDAGIISTNIDELINIKLACLKVLLAAN